MKAAHNLFVICHNIRSAHNVGAIFRTADGAGVDKIYLCGITPTPPRPDISKVALGAEATVPFEYQRQTVRLIKRLKQQKVLIIALENMIPGAVDYQSVVAGRDAALIIGNEVGGLPPSILKLADKIMYIPMYGAKESLNVSVAFGIGIYSLRHH